MPLRWATGVVDCVCSGALQAVGRIAVTASHVAARQTNEKVPATHVSAFTLKGDKDLGEISRFHVCSSTTAVQVERETEETNAILMSITFVPVGPH